MTFDALLAAVPLSIACGLLSLFVVSRRWAFIGEGIGHSGFGGAGTVWILSLAFPAFDSPAALMPVVTLFCLATALAIGLLTDREGVEGDTAIGVFMVASLAWGFLARQIYRAVRGHDPVGFDELLFGQVTNLGHVFAVSTALLSGAVVVVIGTLAKELVFYTVDPATARAAGVRTRLVHYVLLITVTLTIVLGTRVAGSVLVTALLILPGATGLAVGRSVGRAVGASIVVAVVGAVTGVTLHAHWPPVPVGPAIVLTLFVMYLACVTGDTVLRAIRPPRAANPAGSA